uniref:Uncharacterized protein n=1 Tax=Oryzias latipes TaxID=8090 RepID=A0A3P9J6W7_ORYLA
MLVESLCFRLLDVDVLLLETRLCSAETMTGMMGCYILDGFLILYGIVLTVLYFRLKVRLGQENSHFCKQSDQNRQSGLTSPSTDTYDTVRTNKKLMV